MDDPACDPACHFFGQATRRRGGGGGKGGYSSKRVECAMRVQNNGFWRVPCSFGMFFFGEVSAGDSSLAQAESSFATGLFFLDGLIHRRAYSLSHCLWASISPNGYNRSAFDPNALALRPGARESGACRACLAVAVAVSQSRRAAWLKVFPIPQLLK